MTQVVFVGDEPSQYNLSNDIAFVGTNSFTTLVTWISFLKPDYYVCLNSNNKKDCAKIATLYEAEFKIVALGRLASNRLNELNIQHFNLGHPSGLNRQNNNKNELYRKLNLCHEYIRS